MKMTAKKVLSGTMWMAKGTTTMAGLAIMLALVLGAGTTALAAVPGDPFRLGQANVISKISTLAGNTNDAMLRITNNSTAANATALDLRVKPGKAPMEVNSATRVANLNSDKLDGKDANGLIRVASFNGTSPLPAGTNGTVAKTTITAPAAGFLVITAGSDAFNFSESDRPTCLLEVDDAPAPGSARFFALDADQDVNQGENCSTNAVVAVSAGQHKIELGATNVDPGTEWDDTALSAIYVPFGATGSPPSPAAISAAGEIAAPEAREVGRNQ